ncbi:MAG: endonuclease/exonuclease/phosphatase family protein [Bacteroidales bacterium]|nr:endonuclease/exonuclease/phosphatase family protein [Bacteroidales bacterium]
MKKAIKIAFLLLNLLIISLFLLSTMAGHWQPVGKLSVGVSLLGYGFVILWGLNMACCIVWLVFGSRWFLLSLGAMLLRMSYIPLYMQVGNTVKEAGERNTITVLDFNLHGYKGPETNFDLSDTNARLFLQLVDSLQPDVICLQEFTRKTKNVNVVDSMRNKGYRHCANAESTNTDRPGQEAFFSRLPVVATHKIGERSKFYADIIAHGDTVRVFCMHLGSYSLNDSDMEELNNISHGDIEASNSATLRKFVSTIRKHGQEWQMVEPLVTSTPYPTLYCGDWNDTPASYFYQNLTRHATDAYRECGSGTGTTYHGPFPAFRIDYICHSNDIETISYRRIKSDISDHYPIVATLALPSKP